MRQREGKLSLKKVEVEEKGIRYTTWRLDGYDMNGKRVRFSSKDRQTAQLKLIELQAAIHNAAVETPVHVVHTRLSDARLRDAEAAIELLGDRGVTLLDAVRAALDDGGLSVRL